MTTVPAHIVACVDQHRAALRDLVHLAHDHAQRGCNLPGGCAGRQVFRTLDSLGHDRVAALAFLAIAELAALDKEIAGNALGGPVGHVAGQGDA